MKLENPRIPEGINVSKEHPLKELAWLLGIVAIAAAVLVGTISVTAGYLATLIPFSYERELVERFPSLHPEPSPTREYLQDLADRIAATQDLPGDMVITVHYKDEDVVNAFATLGGNVFFYRGLIEKLGSEDALAMVMAHEIAHIKHRHPVVAMGRALTTGIALSAVAGFSGSSTGERLIGDASMLTALSFSRGQESESDKTALESLIDLYGHGAGAVALLEVFLETHGESPAYAPEFLSTHPHT
ncbi:MAG: M48 family metallopeptidase, partial [Gammaproteobacteria bacterium]